MGSTGARLSAGGDLLSLAERYTNNLFACDRLTHDDSHRVGVAATRIRFRAWTSIAPRCLLTSIRCTNWCATCLRKRRTINRTVRTRKPRSSDSSSSFGGSNARSSDGARNGSMAISLLGLEDLDADIARVRARHPAASAHDVGSQPTSHRQELPDHLPREDVAIDIE